MLALFLPSDHAGTLKLLFKLLEDVANEVLKLLEDVANEDLQDLLLLHMCASFSKVVHLAISTPMTFIFEAIQLMLSVVSHHA